MEGIDVNPIFKLPPEMWEMVFEYLVDADDIFRTQEAHPYLKSVANRKRKAWMFEKIIPVLFPYLDYNDVLNCRVICKRWKGGISKYLEIHPTLWPVTVPPSCMTSSAYRLFDGLVLSPETVDEYHSNLDKRDYYRAHPILSRHVTIEWTDFDEVDSDEEEDEDGYVELRFGEPGDRMKAFWDKSMELFEDFYERIWYLTISIDTEGCMDMSDTFFFIFLQKSLARLPYLKSVIVKGDLGLFCSPTSLSKVLKKHPLPPLADLQSFSIEIPDLSMEVESAIYRSYGSQLKKLRMCSALLEEKYTPKEVVNFTELHLHSIRAEPISDIQMLLTWRRLNCPLLQKLTLAVKEMQMATVIAVLQSCPVLRVLKIICEDITSCALDVGALAEPQRVYTSLKELVIWATPLQSYDLLRRVPSLEYLVIGEKKSMETFAKVVLHENLQQILEPPRETIVYQSNLWSILPLLRKLVYVESEPPVFQSYSRERYEYFLPQQAN